MYLKNGNISVNFSVLIKDIISLNLNVFIADNDNNNMIMQCSPKFVDNQLSSKRFRGLASDSICHHWTTVNIIVLD